MRADFVSILWFLINKGPYTYKAICEKGLVNCDLKGTTGNPRPPGEAQGRELQQPLRTLGFLTKLCLFFVFARLREELCDIEMKGTGTSRPVGEAQKKLKGSRD